MKHKTKATQVRLTACANDVRQWADLTGKSESAIADLFCSAGLLLVSNAKSENAERLQLWARGYASQLNAACEAQKLRMQAKALNSRAAKIIRDSKPTTEKETSK